ncbi:MAG: hypothetical protein M1812_003651 [Candelaria pacifica]|nr:MAG: hypothetical protein M1812_003651 [Candelaria pacifica]
MLRFPLTQGSASSQSSRTGKNPTPSRALFKDLSSAYTSITARSTSAQQDQDAETSSDTAQLSECWVNEVSLPSVPAAIHHASNNVGFLPEAQSRSSRSRPINRMPARPPSWKQKFSSVFHRNINNRSLSTLLPTTETRLSDGETRSHDAPNYTSVDINQSVHRDVASPSALAPGEASRLSSFTGRTSSHYDDSIIHHVRFPSSQYAPSSDGATAIPYRCADDLAVEYSSDGPYSQPQIGSNLRNDRWAWTDGEPLPTSETNRLTRNSTGQSLLGSYGADRGASRGSMCFDDVPAGDTKVQSLPTKEGASQEAFLLSKAESEIFNPYSTSASNGFETLVEATPNDTAIAHANVLGRNPATSPPPTRPHAVVMPLLLGRDRDGSTVTYEVSQGSSYGDTRDLLNISTVPSSLHSKVRVGLGPSDGATPPLPRDFSITSSRVDNNDCLQKSSSRREKYLPPIADPQSQPQLMSGSGRVALERQISKELRRISHLSGLSNLSGSIVVLDEETSRSGSFNDKGHADLGPGASQSSSSHDQTSQIMAFNSGSLSDDRSAGASLYRYNQLPKLGRHGLPNDRMSFTGEGSSFASTTPITESSALSRNLALTEEYRGDEDLDWVTEADSRAFSKYDTENDLPLGMTGSSLADYSSYGSLVSHSRETSQLPPLKKTIQHPADERYEYVYRLRQPSENGQSLLLPDYSYGSGNGFPNRNALTTPMAASSSISNTYQHPTPLTKQHAHPFNSSPPPLSSEKNISSTRNVGRRLAIAALQGDENPDFEDERSVDTSAAASILETSEESLIDSLGCYKSDRHQVLSFAASLGLGRGFDTLRPSSTWITTNGDDTADVGPLDAHAGSTGSFSKITTLGPRGNITGSPQGTGMRQVGSSLADASSPVPNWSSSPPQPMSSQPMTTHERSNKDTDTSEKASKSVEGSVGNEAHCNLHPMCGASCGHCQHLRAKGIFRSVPTDPERFHVGLTAISSLSPYESMRYLGHSVATDPSTASYNQTPSLAHLERKHARVAMPSAACLQRLPRPASSVATTSRQRKQTLSRVMLALCSLFPPFLILFGYGYMDGIIVQITDGQIEHFGRKEKQLALWLGYTLGVLGVVGTVVGMLLRLVFSL